jgi:hypothetical protein
MLNKKEFTHYILRPKIKIKKQDEVLIEISSLDLWA